jgi:hypothetical protein
MYKRKERDILRAILRYLKVMQIPAWRQSTGATTISGRFLRFGKTGMSDIIGILPGGKFLAIEVKNGKNSLTEKQRQFLQLICSFGGVGIVARSVEDVVKTIEKIRKEEKYYEK